MSGGDARIFLLNFFGLRRNFDVRHLARFDFAASINDSPLVSPFLLICSHHNAVPVVPRISSGITQPARMRCEMIGAT
jgi:hypothetical protein